MAWQLMGINELKRRAVFLIITLTVMTANLAYCVELNPIEIGQQTEKLGIVGVLVVVIVLQAIGLLYLLRLLATKIIAIIEKNSVITQQMIDAIEHCKGLRK